MKLKLELNQESDDVVEGDISEGMHTFIDEVE